MTIYNSKTWIADVDAILGSLPELEKLAGGSVMITGAAGLICSSLVDILLRYNGAQALPEKKITIYAAGRSREKMAARFGNLMEREEFHFVAYDASRTDNQPDVHCDYIIHGAGNAFPGRIMKEPVETMLSNFTGLRVLLDGAKDKGGKRLLYISSSEVYGRKAGDRPYGEDEYGYIDQLNSRNSYSVGKRAAETLCAAYFDEYGVESVIVRPGHIYGPTASSQDNRVSSAWAYAAARGEAIVMKSDGSQLRSYCYCLDCAAAILKVLIQGENVHAYNISNPASVLTIRQVAELLAQAGGVEVRTELPTGEERRGFNPMGQSVLDSSRLGELGWRGLFDGERGLTHTVEILKEMLEKQ